MAYAKPPKAFEKLERAEKSFRPAIMLAPAGWGKTAAAAQFYNNKPVLNLSCRRGVLDAMPPPDAIRKGTVIIDDISWLTDAASEEYILDLLNRGGRQIVLIGRGHFPAWLSHVAFELDFVHITAKDLALTEKQVEKLFQLSGAEVSGEEAEAVTRVMQGYPPAIKLCVSRAENGEAVGRTMFAEVRIDLFHFYEKAFFDQWPEGVRELLLAVCRYPVFSPEQAEFLSGRRDVAELLECCRNIGSFLERLKPDTYVLLNDLRAFLCWKQELLWPRARIEENYRNAAYYYKMQDRMYDALFYYDKAGDSGQIQQVLIENARRHPGVGQYYELKNYYEALPRELVLESPVLMAGMSMLFSLTMRVEQSEQWYQELSAFERNGRNARDRRREAKAWLAYLEIGLPHRAGKGLIGIFRKLYALHQNENISVPDLAVTGNYPSLMNGSLDFCEWAKNAEQVARFIQKPVETLLGDFGKGLVNIGLAESGFERGTMSPYEVVTRLNNGYAAASHGGKIEMCFAAEGVLARQHTAMGQLPTAVRLLEVFREKAAAERAQQIMPNLDALSVWLSLYAGDEQKAEAHLESMPDIHGSFYLPNRFRYAVGLRCLIFQEKYTDAMNLAGYMTHYYEQYKRTYLWIENELLKAVILFRTGQAEWRRVLKGALVRAEEYHLVRVVSMEGAAALPLLTEAGGEGISEAFYKELLQSTREMALRYPDYMKYVPRVSVELTAREQEILTLLCAGKTTEEICESCGITYSGLKKHNRSIYAKLGVKTRAEAERMAARMGLTHRKEGTR